MRRAPDNSRPHDIERLWIYCSRIMMASKVGVRAGAKIRGSVPDSAQEQRAKIPTRPLFPRTLFTDHA